MPISTYNLPKSIICSPPNIGPAAVPGPKMTLLPPAPLPSSATASIEPARWGAASSWSPAQAASPVLSAGAPGTVKGWPRSDAPTLCGMGYSQAREGLDGFRDDMPLVPRKLQTQWALGRDDAEPRRP